MLDVTSRPGHCTDCTTTKHSDHNIRMTLWLRVVRVEANQRPHVDRVADGEAGGAGLDGERPVIQLIVTQADARLQQPGPHLLCGLDLVGHLLEHPHLPDDMRDLRNQGSVNIIRTVL